jgi:hypothetical protein
LDLPAEEEDARKNHKYQQRLVNELGSPFSDIAAKLVSMSENGETCSRRAGTLPS